MRQEIKKMRKTTPVAILGTLFLAIARPGMTQEGSADPLVFSLGLSYLATSGNTETSTAAIDAKLTWLTAPWTVEAVAAHLRSEQDGIATAERTNLGLRGSRAMGESWDLFAGLTGLTDEFAGIDMRAVAEAGVTFRYLEGPVHSLALDVGATWTRDDPVIGETDSFVGALAAARYAWKISDSAELSERLSFFPSLEETDDWRIESDFAVQATLTKTAALKLSYLLRHDNVPVAGFEKTDSATGVSLVLKF
jgi:putative salt-induced outer membrane protein